VIRRDSLLPVAKTKADNGSRRPGTETFCRAFTAALQMIADVNTIPNALAARLYTQSVVLRNSTECGVTSCVQTGDTHVRVYGYCLQYERDSRPCPKVV